MEERVGGGEGLHRKEERMDGDLEKENHSSCFIITMSLAMPYPLRKLNQYTNGCNAMRYIIIVTERI